MTKRILQDLLGVLQVDPTLASTMSSIKTVAETLKGWPGWRFGWPHFCTRRYTAVLK